MFFTEESSVMCMGCGRLILFPMLSENCVFGIDLKKLIM